MLDKKLIPVDHLTGIMDSVYEYNSLGKVVGITFHAADQSRVEVAYIEVVSDSLQLKVRSKPESEDPNQSSLASAYGLDPRLVPGPQSMAELAKQAIGE